ncbi:ATP phosphoribosyltransferase [Puniceicoccaceae bacterium K14]|nr:ATP phosphoribosyltransferase [Puniceicoccaceae bacterium K14]
MSQDQSLIMFGFPKGSLEDATIKLFAKAGWSISKSSRSYRPSIDDNEIDGRFIRGQEISRYVEHGYFDCGLCGYDWVVENRSDVVEVCDLVYSRASNRPSYWVLCVPESSPIKTVKDLQGKRIATEVTNLTNDFLAKHGVEAETEFSWGATEVKVPDMVDAIVDLTETGNSLRANKLRIVETLLKTNTKLIANKKSWENPEKRKKIENIALMLSAALSAADKVGLKLNSPREKLDEVLGILPALRKPTVNSLSEDEWVAIEVVLSEKDVRDLIPKLKEIGAEGIIEYPLNKVVY